MVKILPIQYVLGMKELYKKHGFKITGKLKGKIGDSIQASKGSQTVWFAVKNYNDEYIVGYDFDLFDKLRNIRPKIIHPVLF